MKVGNVSIGTSFNRLYRHHLPYDINTTCDFGSCQPVLSQYMEKDDKFTFDCTQLVRLATTINPTFGTIHSRFDARFVSMAEIFPAFDALQSHTNVTTSSRSYVPVSVPMVTNQMLWFVLLTHCKVTVYKASAASSTTEHSKSFDLTRQDPTSEYSDFLTGLQSTVAALFDEEVGGYPFDSLVAILYSQGVASYSFSVSPAAADFYIHSSFQGSEYVFCARLDNGGRKLRKILLGLGYSCEYSDRVPVSFLPVLGFYKAWFDQYAPQRYITWHSTNFYKFINLCYTEGKWDFTFHNVQLSESDDWSLFELLFDDLIQGCVYTYPDNFFSVHTDQVFTVQNDFEEQNNPSSNGTILGDSTQGTIVPVQKSSVDFRTSVSIDTVRRLTKFLSKNSIIGKNVANYFKVHYGSEPVDDMFADSKFIGSWDTIPEIKTLVSSSDTMSGEGVGEPLGKQGSFGVGAGNHSISYVANTFGFAFVFHSMYPELHFNQGFDPWLRCHDRYTFPSVEFDALGYELTSKGQIYDNGGVRTYTPNDINLTTFGFIPRNSGLKAKKSICNGNMSLRSTRNSFDSFYLDASIRANDLIWTPAAEPGQPSRVVESHYSIPDASVNWRYLLRYPFLGYFNRIFLNSGPLDQDSFAYFLRGDAIDDNFTLQCHVDYSLVNKLKPLSQSFDTYDEDVDHGTTNVKPE